MNKSQKILLISCLSAIFILLMLSNFIAPKTLTPIESITNESLGKQVLIEGNIKSIAELNNKTFFLISVSNSNKSITVTASSRFPSDLKERINYSSKYLIKGKVEEYNKSIQISADLITSS